MFLIIKDGKVMATAEHLGEAMNLHAKLGGSIELATHHKVTNITATFVKLEEVVQFTVPLEASNE